MREAAALFGGTDVASVWKYNRATRRWDLSYQPARDRGGFPIAGGDVLWVVAPAEQPLRVDGTRPPGLPDPGPIALALREGGDIVAGAVTTAADLFGGTDVASAWEYNRPDGRRLGWPATGRRPRTRVDRDPRSEAATMQTSHNPKVGISLVPRP